jgi:hypothetical protein
MDSAGHWIRQHEVPTPPVEGLNQVEAVLRKIVDKSVLIDNDDTDNDHIDEIGQVDPWQDYFNKSQQPKVATPTSGGPPQRQPMMIRRNLRVGTSSVEKTIDLY